jgi:hypothetical protein
MEKAGTPNIPFVLDSSFHALSVKTNASDLHVEQRTSEGTPDRASMPQHGRTPEEHIKFDLGPSFLSHSVP